ncbi:MAG: WYL domain-containing protein [Kangiella sp.]|nr:WYL domain-containing protein [Kangiella sp.]
MASITVTQSVKWWLLGFGDQVEVIKPKALREEMKKIAKGMISLYQ